MGKEIIGLFVFVFTIVVMVGAAFDFAKKKYQETTAGPRVEYSEGFSPEEIKAEQKQFMDDYQQQMDDYKRQQETTIRDSQEQQRRMMEDQKRQLEDLRRQTRGY